MILNRIATSIKNQDWFVVFVELLIVVVGIYIGLQVDGWNKEREAKAVTETYYERLLDDLNSEKTTNLARVAYSEMVRKHGMAAHEVLTTPDAELGEQFLIDIYQATQLWPYEAQRSTYDELLSGGIANAIPDIQLRTRLANFYNAYGSLDFTQQELPVLRDRIRGKMPLDVQNAIRQQCGDSISRTADFLVNVTFNEFCSLDLSEAQIENAVSKLLQYSDLEEDLTRQLADLEIKLLLLDWNLTPIDMMVGYIEEAKK